MAFYKDRFADAGDFTFVFVGSFNADEMKPLVERYLASLPTTGRKESWKDTGVRYARGVVQKRVDKGLEPQSRAAIVFTGPFTHNQTERVAIRAMAEVLQSRLHETLRESLGGTYGVTAAAGYLQIPVPEFSVNISFSCAPERTEELVKAALQQVELLKSAGPTEKQLTDAKEKLLRDFETNRKQNNYLLAQLSIRYQYGEDLDNALHARGVLQQAHPRCDSGRREAVPESREHGEGHAVPGEEIAPVVQPFRLSYAAQPPQGRFITRPGLGSGRAGETGRPPSSRRTCHRR